MTADCIHGYPAPQRCPWCKHHTSTTATVATVETPLDWNTAAMHTLWELAHSGQPFTSEDITDRVGFPGVTRANGNNGVGLFIQRNAKRLRLRRYDQRPARNPQSHGRLVTVWIGRAS